MTRIRLIVTVMGLGVALMVQWSSVTSAQVERREAKFGPPRFTDPDRRTKLTAAFPEIDRLFGEFAAERHAPGLAYGILFDGDLVHSSAIGFQDIDTKAPVDIDTSSALHR